MVFPQFTPAQPNALRILNRKYSDMQTMRWTVEKPINDSQRNSTAWELANKFCKSSSIHGVNRLLSDSTNKYERLIWIIIVLLAFSGYIYVCLIISKRFNEERFETVIESTRFPVYRLHFPVVTICNLNRLNWERLEAAKAKFLPAEESQEKIALFEKIIAAYDDIAFAKFDRFAVLEHEPLELLNHINFTLVFDFMTWRCDELLTSCIWRHYGLDCCKIFLKRKTKRGICYAFNTMETEEGRSLQRADPFYPWRTGSSGPTSALTLRVLINKHKHYPNNTNDKGINVMINEPNVWDSDNFNVPIDTRAMCILEPIMYFFDKATRSISSSQRHCVFSDEITSANFKSLPGFIYMFENCESQCHQEYMMRFCNCTMDLLFPMDFVRYSHLQDEEKYVRNHFPGMVCECLRNCYSLFYNPYLRTLYLPERLRENESYVDLDVHYRFNTLMLYRTRLVFDWVDLLAAFGGIAGLFLGCSLISAVELLYFSLIELPHFIIDELKEKWQQWKFFQKFRWLGLKQRIVTPQSTHNVKDSYY
ncbi:pickpocket protein 19-like [Teleopsis dalmanni]|uniref:pickpocket protein 19-like n=1 Tax=Teleopsis dalmanni TaxID=139649 RepID=UPI0018CE2179|nr:pickpocket protein 19-like [Teleopsis dalmanni]